MTPPDKNILKNMGTVSAGTLLSRITGLFRDQIMAIIFGATGSIVPDAYYAAFKIPNSLRNLLAEGGMTAAFLPTFKGYLLEDNQESRNVSNAVFTFLSILLIILTIIGIIFSPQIIYLTASGFAKDPEKFKLAVLLLRILFPYLFLISTAALASAILNSFYHFLVPSLTPVLLNLAIIVSAVISSRFMSTPIIGVAAGILAGGALQVSIQIPHLIKHRHMFSINFNYRHPALKKILLLLVPTLFTFSIYEITAIIEQQIASHIEQGTISVLYFANRLYQLPLAIFAIALSSALLPALSDAAAINDIEGIRNKIGTGIKTIFILSLPSAVFLFLMSGEIFEVLFEYGNFSARDTLKCSSALKAYSTGLIFISLYRIFTQAFYAMKNTRTPAISSFITLIFFVSAAPAMTFLTPLGYLGLPVATALSTAVNFSFLLYSLNKSTGKIIEIFFDKNIFKIISLSILLTALLLIFTHFIRTLPEFPGILSLAFAGVLTLISVISGFNISKMKLKGISRE